MLGGYIAADDVICDAVQFWIRFIFTTAPPALAYGALASVQYLQSSQAERDRQKQQAETLKQKLRNAGLPILEGDTHIVPVMVNNADQCTRICQFLLNERQIYVQPINYSTVPKGTERLRLTPGPFHSDSMIDDLVDALQMAFSQIDPKQPNRLVNHILRKTHPRLAM